MTQGYRDAVEAMRWLINDLLQEKFQFVYALLGDGQGNVDVPGRENYVYIRYERASDRVSQVFNRTVTGGHNTPVVVGYLPWQPDLQQVLDVNWQAWIKQEGVWSDENIGTNAPHGPSHIWSDNEVGSDTFNIYTRQIFPLRLESLSTTSSGSFAVRVQPYGLSLNDQYRYWPGGPNLDLSGLVPATGSQRYALVYWNPFGGEGIYGRLGVVTGSLAPHDGVNTPDRPSEPSGTIPSGFALLYGGQAGVYETNLYEARELLTPNSSIGGGSEAIDQAKVSKLWQPDASNVVAEANDSDLDLLLHGSLNFDNASARIIASSDLDISVDAAGVLQFITDNNDRLFYFTPGQLELNSDQIDLDFAIGTLQSQTSVNLNGATGLFRAEGQTDANLLSVVALTDRVGIGTVAPATKLDVNGDVTLTEYTYHGGDTDTFTRFQLNQWGLTVGNVAMINAQETTQDVLELGDVAGTGDVDVNVNNGALFAQGSDRFVGVGTNAPANQLDIRGSGFELMAMARSTSGGVGFKMANTLTSLNVGLGAGATPLFFAGAPGGADNFFGITTDELRVQSGMKIGWSSSNTDAATGGVADTYFSRLSAGAITTPGALVIGSPTGGSKGNGTLNVSSGIYLNNSLYNNPHYVFERHYTGDIVKYKDRAGADRYEALTIEEIEDYSRTNYHLPGIPDTPTDIFERADIALEKIEELYLFAFDQNRKIKVLENQINELKAGK